ncbi:MAG: HEAT repeat domain-containing protein [Longimicrobiaceae bacterium]
MPVELVRVGHVGAGVSAAGWDRWRLADRADGADAGGVLAALQGIGGEGHQAAEAAAQRRGRARQLGSPEAVPVLAAALADDEPLARGHAAWGLGWIGTAGAMQALRGRMDVEEDEWVREELSLALSG